MRKINSIYISHIAPNLQVVMDYSKEFYESLLSPNPSQHNAVNAAVEIITTLNNDALYVIATGAMEWYQRFLQDQADREIPRPSSLTEALYILGNSEYKNALGNKLRWISEYLNSQTTLTAIQYPNNEFKIKFPNMRAFYKELQTIDTVNEGYDTTEWKIKKASEKISMREYLQLAKDSPDYAEMAYHALHNGNSDMRKALLKEGLPNINQTYSMSYFKALQILLIADNETKLILWK